MSACACLHAHFIGVNSGLVSSFSARSPDLPRLCARNLFEWNLLETIGCVADGRQWVNSCRAAIAGQSPHARTNVHTHTLTHTHTHTHTRLRRRQARNQTSLGGYSHNATLHSCSRPWGACLGWRLPCERLYPLVCLLWQRDGRDVSKSGQSIRWNVD